MIDQNRKAFRDEDYNDDPNYNPTSVMMLVRSSMTLGYLTHILRIMTKSIRIMMIVMGVVYRPTLL